MTPWLLTWLWQGAAVASAVAVLLHVAHLALGRKPFSGWRANAATRYLVWWGGLAAVIWLGCVSSPYAAPFAAYGPYGGLTPVPVQGSDPMQEPLFQVQSASPLLMSVFLGIWAAIALAKLLRLLPELHLINTLRDACRPVPRDLESQLPLWLEAKERGRRTRLVLCDAVGGATVLGFQRPCIALPPALVAALSVDEIDQIVLHEYAHVQRHDDWTRLLQALLEAALWVHPAVAFIGRSLNREREMACDEWVVARTGLPTAFARCLARAAQVRGRSRVEPSLVPALFRRQHDLVHRVNRLLGVRGRTRKNVSLPVLGAAACVTVAITVQLNAVPLVGEYVEVVLPQVAAPAFLLRSSPIALRVADAHSAALHASAGEPEDRIGPQTRLHVSAPAVRATGGMAGDVPGTAPDETADESDQTPEHATAPLSARSYPGAYESRLPAVAARDAGSSWGAAAAPGLAIAGVARKTGVGLAGAFSRAGVALARRF